MRDVKEKRRFTGKLSGFVSKQERNFCKKQLKAYLRGWTHFKYGKNTDGTPKVHETPQEYYTV